MRDQPRARGIRPFLIAAAAVAACSALAPPPNCRARETQRADVLKADYLFTLLKFVDWPPIAPADILNACFLSNSGVYEEFSARASDKRVGSRRVLTRQLAPGEPITTCQMLYIDAEQLESVAAQIYPRPTALLTVSNAPDFLRSGGIVALFEKDERLGFRISADNARLAGLRISSNLLRLEKLAAERAES